MNHQSGQRPVEAVYLLAHKYYMRLTRICVASIRHWYPEIPIYLIKDKIAGDFSTDEIERAWNVQVFPTDSDKFGWGFAHLEPMLRQGGQRALVIDVDIVFVGRVIDLLSSYNEDMIVQQEDQPEHPGEKFDGLYFKLDRIKEIDPDFRFPGFSFNAGQFVITTGVLTREDFAGLINWSSPRSVVRPDIFSRGDQGVFNYVVMKRYSEGTLSVARIPFMVWNPAEMEKFDINLLNDESPYQQLIHWAGSRRPRMKDMPRADILFMFEDLYYSRIPMRRMRFVSRLIGSVAANFGNKVRARLSGTHAQQYLT